MNRAHLSELDASEAGIDRQLAVEALWTVWVRTTCRVRIEDPTVGEWLATDSRYGVSATAASGVATWKLKLCSR